MNDVRPFEEYKEMIKDMSKEEMIKGLYDLSKNIIEKENEIEKIKRQKEELQINGLRQETLFKLEIERLNDTIKTLEEYVIGEQISEYGDTLEEAKEYLEKLKRS